MQPQDDTGSLIRRARPDTTLRDESLDLDAILREGYRARRRSRAVLSGAATAGVAAVATVLAFSAGMFDPSGGDLDRQQGFPAGEPFDFDPATATYPDPGDDEWDVRKGLDEAGKAAFGNLAIDTGFLDADALDYERPSEEEIQAAIEDGAEDYGEALSDLGYNSLPLMFSTWSSPVSGGQAYLRGFDARDGDEEAERSSFEIIAIQPGGWTAEPGPTGDLAFPQHLISDEASWTEEAPEFTTEELDDGRTLMVADHGCALEALVVYPNDSALFTSWDLDCEGQSREMRVDDLSSAMLAMPQFDYDTSELAPIELLDMPPGWPLDESWEAAAPPDAATTAQAAGDHLSETYPDTELLNAAASQLQYTDSVVRRTYESYFELPFEDAGGLPVQVSLRYFLPGGWLPGLPPEEKSEDPYLVDCVGDDKDDTCEQFEANGRTVATRTFGIGERISYWIVVYDPAGWAVELNASFDGTVDGFAYEDLVDLASALPAPVYDPEEYASD
jgi:hypothetical protein